MALCIKNVRKYLYLFNYSSKTSDSNLYLWTYEINKQQRILTARVAQSVKFWRETRETKQGSNIFNTLGVKSKQKTHIRRKYCVTYKKYQRNCTPSSFWSRFKRLVCFSIKTPSLVSIQSVKAIDKVPTGSFDLGFKMCLFTV